MSFSAEEIHFYFEQLIQRNVADAPEDFQEYFEAFLNLLNNGQIRAAAPTSEGKWVANVWVKRTILLGFRFGVNTPHSNAEPFWFSDKDTYPIQKDFGVDRNVRIVPGGSSVRAGAFIGKNVTMMPPMYVNTGAYVDDGTMIDSHALVGSCAQIGKKVHLSAACQIGGVLEPVNASPVVVEDECMIGGNTGIYEGTVIRKGAVIGAGVVLTRSTPVYDLVNETVYRGTAESPLEIPAGAVVVPGSRPISKGTFALNQGLHIATPVIIKYRDDKTDAATTLEMLLR